MQAPPAAFDWDNSLALLAAVSIIEMAERRQAIQKEPSAKERIVLALCSNSRLCSVPGIYNHFVRQHQQFFAYGLDDVRMRPAPKVCSADAALEEGIAGEEPCGPNRVQSCGSAGSPGRFWGRNLRSALGTQVSRPPLDNQADAPRRVPRRVQNAGCKAAPAELVAFFQKFVNFGRRRRAHAQPLRLQIKMAVQTHVRLMDKHRGARYLVQSGEAADVVNMRMRADDGVNLQFVLAQYLRNALDFIAGVHNDRLTGRGIAQDRAIALQHPDGDHFMDQFLCHRRLV
jgi:hypothetical protein